MLSMAGGKPQKTGIDDALEMIRGAFVVHTRGYNVPKPLEPTSNFGMLYALARAGADRHDPTPIPLHALGKRTDVEQAHFEMLLAQRGHNVVEPTFIPPAPWTIIQIESAVRII